MNKYISIEKTKYLHDHTLKLTFNDGIETETEIDFFDSLKSSHHPEIIKYLQLENFKQFHLNHGDLEWNDFELSFPVYDLYQGNILH